MPLRSIKSAKIKALVSGIYATVGKYYKCFFWGVVTYLMPPKCLSCRELIWGEAGLCCICWKKCTFIRELCCIKCGRLSRYQGLICGFCIQEPPDYECARSLIDFNFVSKGFIHDLKYRDRTDLIHFFAKLLASAHCDLVADVDMVIPVPMHYFRRMLRSYNQAHILAFALANNIGKQFAPWILKKSRLTPTQTLMNKKKRKQNLKGSFNILNVADIKGKKVLLIDDVMTTGSTVNICSKVLKNAGAVSVKVLTIASVR